MSQLFHWRSIRAVFDDWTRFTCAEKRLLGSQRQTKRQIKTEMLWQMPDSVPAAPTPESRRTEHLNLLRTFEQKSSISNSFYRRFRDTFESPDTMQGKV